MLLYINVYSKPDLLGHLGEEFLLYNDLPPFWGVTLAEVIVKVHPGDATEAPAATAWLVVITQVPKT